MALTAELQRKIDTLQNDLNYSISCYSRLARLHYRVSLVLSYATVLSSLGAGAGGILLHLDGQTTGVLALLPVILATFAMNLKLQEKGNWHYRKKDALNAFSRLLRFKMKEDEAEKTLDEIIDAWNELDRTMDAQWEKEFAFPWTNYLKGPSQGQQ